MPLFRYAEHTALSVNVKVAPAQVLRIALSAYIISYVSRKNYENGKCRNRFVGLSSNANSASSFELTAGAGDAGAPPCSEAAGAMLTVPPQAHHQAQHNSRKRKNHL
ncbi:unnamed protein product [Euphydryas editha]|uniref:Uncharacterized protein n=1 Tax=Euphydryas editha TaxID=104508 RepID=A0AAU9UWA4_EUPED|nr:unnamed protein product [Euphydryas editha]